MSLAIAVILVHQNQRILTIQQTEHVITVVMLAMSSVETHVSTTILVTHIIGTQVLGVVVASAVLLEHEHVQ